MLYTNILLFTILNTGMYHYLPFTFIIYNYSSAYRKYFQFAQKLTTQLDLTRSNTEHYIMFE